MAWRNWLDTVGKDDEDDEARMTLAATSSQLLSSKTYKGLVQSVNALRVICQRQSSIRDSGDDVAHSYAESRDDITTLKNMLHLLLDDELVRGMKDVLDCLSSVKFPPKKKKT
jgi:hypothetical protein